MIAVFYRMIPTAGTEKRSRRFLQIAHIKISYIFAIFFPSLADSKRAFLALPCRESIRRLSASPHGNLTPALSPGHSRVSIIVPPACHRHRRVLSPNGRTLVLRLADLSAAEVLYRINWYEDAIGHLVCQ